jgi:hypothetical protein
MTLEHISPNQYFFPTDALHSFVHLLPMYVALVIKDVTTDEYPRNYSVHDRITGVSPSQGLRSASFLQKAVQTVSSFHPASYQNCAAKYFTGIKRSERHYDFSHRLISAETNYAKLHFTLKTTELSGTLCDFSLPSRSR